CQVGQIHSNNCQPRWIAGAHCVVPWRWGGLHGEGMAALTRAGRQDVTFFVRRCWAGEGSLFCNAIAPRSGLLQIEVDGDSTPLCVSPSCCTIVDVKCLGLDARQTVPRLTLWISPLSPAWPGGS